MVRIGKIIMVIIRKIIMAINWIFIWGENFKIHYVTLIIVHFKIIQHFKAYGPQKLDLDACITE